MSESEDQHSSFSIVGTDSSFRGRTNDVFDCLNVIEAKHSAFEKANPKPENDDDPDFESKDGDDFKAPFGSAPKAKTVPQFQRKPDNWTMYNLSDVKCSTSDAGNAATAHEFIDSLKKSKEMVIDDDDDDDDDDGENTGCMKHTFRKPNLKRNSNQISSSKKSKKVTLSGLDHLLEKDEEEEGGDAEKASAVSTGFKKNKRTKRNMRSRDENSSEEEEEVVEEKKEEKEEESSEEEEEVEEEEDEEDPNDGLT